MLINSLLGGNFSIYSLLSSLASSVLVVFLCWPVREYARGLVAVKLGDPTPKYSGKLTLNPLAHIDPIGAVAMVLFGFGWGNGPSINPYYLKKPKRDIALISLAGPAANIILGFIFYIFMKTFSFGTSTFINVLYLTCYYAAFVNVSLAAFHLIPIPPLDASNLLPLFMSDRAYNRFMMYERYFSIFLILIIVTGILDYPIYVIKNFIFTIYNLFTFWI